MGTMREKLIPESQNQSSCRSVFYVFAFALIYSVVRYHIFKGVGWEHLPLFIGNKVMALTGILLIALSVLTRSKSRESYDYVRKKLYSYSGYFFISLHVLASLVMVNNGYYEKFFSGNQMNLTGELSMLFGIIAFYIYTVTIFRSWLEKENSQNSAAIKKDVIYRYTTHLLVMGHLLFMGLSSWFFPTEWPGYMLPISLLSFLLLLFILPGSLQNKQGGE